jgi:hypothetical protein
MEEVWPAPNPQVADAIRSLCERLLVEAEDLTEALAPPALAAQEDPGLLSDASLVEEDRHLDRSDILQWLTSNVQRPGRRVEPYIGPRSEAYIRGLVARGITPDFVDGWRVALAIGWRRWLEECVTEYGSQPDLLVEILDVSAQSMVQYAHDSVSALREARVSAAVGGAEADAMAMIQMITSGAPVPEDIVERRLGYRMRRSHLGLVLWVEEPDQAWSLDAVVAGVRSTVAAQSVLVAAASVTSRWIWLSGNTAPSPDEVERMVAESDVVRACIGKPGQGLDGFRESHKGALAAQALVMRLGADRSFTAYADVELIDPLTRDRDCARRFIVSTLGRLAHASEELRHTLLTYVQC